MEGERTDYPPHPGQAISHEDLDLRAALEKFTKTSAAPLYLKTAYAKVKQA